MSSGPSRDPWDVNNTNPPWLSTPDANPGGGNTDGGAVPELEPKPAPTEPKD